MFSVCALGSAIYRGMRHSPREQPCTTAQRAQNLSIKEYSLNHLGILSTISYSLVHALPELGMVSRDFSRAAISLHGSCLLGFRV